MILIYFNTNNAFYKNELIDQFSYHNGENSMLTTISIKRPSLAIVQFLNGWDQNQMTMDHPNTELV